jgi:hypothetical protein
MPSTRAPAARPRQPAAGPRRRAPLSLVGLAQLLVAAGIAVGWALREERLLVPDRGPGYVLGLLGLGAMVLLLAYPVRKRWRALRGAGRIGVWFQAHMLLGLVGPLAILYHANFRTGSMNANVALVCMLAVAGSGVVGRVLYVRIHAGLEGRRRTLGELRDALGDMQRTIAASAGHEAVVGPLARFERALLDRDQPAWRRHARRLWGRWSARRAIREVRRSIRSESGGAALRGADAAALSAARRYVRGVREVAGFETWERLFGLWHVAHLPLCLLLFAAAAVHVVAVHLY